MLVGSLSSLLLLGAAAGGADASTTAVTPSPAGGRDLLAVAGPVTRVAGDDRIATGIAAAKIAYPTERTASGAVLARSDGFADALAGAPLARRTGPMLLTGRAALDARVAAELTRVVKPGGTVYVLGTTDVVAPAVQTSVEALGFKVVRLGGADRYATAVAIAQLLQPTAGPTESCLFSVVTGRDFPDALTAANTEGQPILFTNGYTMPEATAAEIRRCAVPDDGTEPRTTYVKVIGGPAVGAVGTTPYTYAGENSVFTNVVGQDRYDTNARAMMDRAGNGEEQPFKVVVATGENYPDALVGAGTFSSTGGRTLVALTRAKTLPQPVREAFSLFELPIADAYIMGSPDIVSDDVAYAVTHPRS